MIYLPAESLGRKQNHMDGVCRKPFFVDGSLGRKQEIADSLGGSQNVMDSLCRKRKLANSFIPCGGVNLDMCANSLIICFYKCEIKLTQNIVSHH